MGGLTNLPGLRPKETSPEKKINMSSTNNMVAPGTETFRVIPAMELRPESHLVLGTPQDASGPTKATFHRVPIRARMMAAGGGAAVVSPQFVAGSTAVVGNVHQGLRRALIKLPKSHTFGINEYQNMGGGGGDNDRTNVVLGVSLYDPRVGPTAEQTTVIKNLEDTALWIRQTMFASPQIRTTLGLGPANMPEEKQRTAAELMDLAIVRYPKAGTGGGDHHINNNKRGRDADGSAATVGAPKIYGKIVSPDGAPNIPEPLLTWFWTPDGTPLTLDQVRQFRSFDVEMYVELDTVFASKSVRSVQLKVREVVVWPPAVRPTQRYSVVFQNQVCQRDGLVMAVDEENKQTAV